MYACRAGAMNEGCPAVRKGNNPKTVRLYRRHSVRRWWFVAVRRQISGSSWDAWFAWEGVN